VAADNEDNCYLLGEFKGRIQFGGADSRTVEGSARRMLLAALDAKGDSLWVRTWSENRQETTYYSIPRLCVTPDGSSLVFSDCIDEVSFESDGNTELYEFPGGRDYTLIAYLVQFGSSGEVLSFYEWSGPHGVFACGLAFDPAGYAVVTGYGLDKFDLDPGPKVRLLDDSQTGAFLIKLKLGEQL
jgi:hypothetical protein